MSKRETGRGVDAVRKVIVVAYPQAKLLDVTGPCEVFADANQTLGSKSRAYDIELVSNHEGPVETSSGVSLIAHRGFAAVRGSIDTLLVVGGPGVTQAAEDAALLRWIVRSAAHARRVGAVCTGAFLLAAAGLLDGRRAVTHWAHCDLLARQYPKVTVDPDAIFVRDGDVYTSAGVTASMDLALNTCSRFHRGDDKKGPRINASAHERGRGPASPTRSGVDPRKGCHPPGRQRFVGRGRSV